MKATELLETFVLFVFLQSVTTSLPAETGRENAFLNDINKCLFTAWTTASGNRNPVLSGPVDCKGKAGSTVQLCYSVLGKPPAQFAVCYNKNYLTPHFSGHIVRPNIQGAGRDSDWRSDTGRYAPKPQATVEDYDPYDQKGLYDNYDIDSQQFCAKGHLTPNADFNEDAERELTMITTNIAPQWQKFNSMNWAALEAAVRRYATNVTSSVFVFTGVGGVRKNLVGVNILMNKRVVTPMWYWKAVCDPLVGESIVFSGENAVGVASNVSEVTGCNGIQQKRDRGVIYCYSLKDASRKYADFKLPPFSKNCNPALKGTFMDNFLNNLN